MIYAFDLDNTLCYTEGTDYPNAKPNHRAIAKVNALYEEGHTIKIFTGRGTVTKIDWTALTKRQLKKWGIKCNELILGKPVYDVFIDDRAINTKDWLND